MDNNAQITSIEPTSKPPKSHLFPLILALLLVLGGTTYYYLKTTYPELFVDISRQIAATRESLKPTPTPQATILPSPSPTLTPYVLPTGSQTYNFSHGSEVKGPKIKTLLVEPLDPKSGDTQTFTLEIKSDPAMTSSLLEVITDNQETSLELDRKSGDAQNGTYQVSWKVSDTYETKYALHFILKNQSDTYDSIMSLR